MKGKANNCITSKYRGIPVYNDIITGVVCLVFEDIPRIYEEIASDEKLASLTVDDWIVALLNLAIPVTQVVIDSANNPPKAPGDDGVPISDIINRIHREALKRAKTEVGKQIYIAENLAIQLRLECERKLAKIINRYRTMLYSSLSQLASKAINQVVGHAGIKPVFIRLNLMPISETVMLYYRGFLG